MALFPLTLAFQISILSFSTPSLSATIPPLCSRRTRLAAEVPRVFLTREEGKNEKLGALLAERGVPTEELPCIACERLAGYTALREALVANAHDWIVITSPEAASVFVDAWRESGSPPLARIATVGAGTTQILTAADLSADFVPSKATGKTLAAELPAAAGGAVSAGVSGGSGLVLYPASALAERVVEDGLATRGFRTLRIETYTTLPATWSEHDAERARAAKVVTFASPSAVRAWVERVGTGATAVCIGETSAEECRRVGFAPERVHCPEKPGVESWAQTIVDVVGVPA
jgi:uroporphyrinogen-III synthase|eukprot:jgi/Chrpa1/23320/Chrysochromulina_OHIO_Genome00008356-RA